MQMAAYTPEEVATILQVTPRTVKKLVKKNILHGVWVGGFQRIMDTDLKKFIEEGGSPGAWRPKNPLCIRGGEISPQYPGKHQREQIELMAYVMSLHPGRVQIGKKLYSPASNTYSPTHDRPWQCSDERLIRENIHKVRVTVGGMEGAKEALLHALSQVEQGGLPLALA